VLCAAGLDGSLFFSPREMCETSHFLRTPPQKQWTDTVFRQLKRRAGSIERTGDGGALPAHCFVKESSVTSGHWQLRTFQRLLAPQANHKREQLNKMANVRSDIGQAVGARLAGMLCNSGDHCLERSVCTN